MSLGTNNADYNSFYALVKGNYRKGTHRFRTLLGNPELAKEFSQSRGAAAVVLGWPIGHDDRNSKELLDLLLGSDVLPQTIITWLGQWYPESAEDADTMYGEAARCQEIHDDPLLWRAVSADAVGLGKLTATLAGLAPSGYADIAALAASEEAVRAVIASPTALSAVVSSSTAMAAVATSSTAMAAVAASSTAMAAVAASQTAMAAVAASQTAMAAVATSSTAMAAVAASSTAMAAVAASATARKAIEGSGTAITALSKSPLAVSVSGSASGTGNENSMFTGKAWFISGTNDATQYGWARYYTIDAPSTPVACSSGTSFTVSKFTSKITAFRNSGSGTTSCTARIIKC